MVIRVKARKCEHYKLKYCLTSSLGILSYAEGSKTTDCQDTVLILGKRMRDSLDMGKHHVKNWPPHPKIDPLIPSGQTPQMISTHQYRRKSLLIHWSSSPHMNSIPASVAPTLGTGEYCKRSRRRRLLAATRSTGKYYQNGSSAPAKYSSSYLLAS